MSILKQPERMKVLKDFNLYNSFGRLLRLVQPFKFISSILRRSPMDFSTTNYYSMINSPPIPLSYHIKRNQRPYRASGSPPQ